MEDKAKLKQNLTNLNESDLRALIDRVGRAMGMSEGQRRAAMAHSGMVRRKLTTASDRELDAMLDKLSPQARAELSAKLGNGGKNGH